MKKEKITCYNCHLPLDANVNKCPYCGVEITEDKKQTEIEPYYEGNLEGKSKKHLQKHTFFWLIALGIEALFLLLQLIPIETNFGFNCYYYAFRSSQFVVVQNNIKYSVVVGTNAPLIIFIFSIVALLNSAALFWSVKKKSAEINLFAGFTAFYCLVIALIGFLGIVLMSNNSAGNAATKFQPSAGLFVIGAAAVAAAVFNILGAIRYKKFLVESPLETFKMGK